MGIVYFCILSYLRRRKWGVSFFYMPSLLSNKNRELFFDWNHLLVMIFGRLCNRESLRDLVNVVSAHKNKSYHLGFGKMFQKPIWHMPTISGITTSLRIMPTT